MNFKHMDENKLIIIRMLLGVLIISSLSGCKPLKAVINSSINGGTVEGASQCIEMGAANLVSEEVIRLSCVGRFEQPLSSAALANLNGRGSPQTHIGDAVFEGSLTNNSINYVITSLEIGVTFHGSNDSEKIEKNLLVRGWFEPLTSSQSFRSDDLENQPSDWQTTDACDEDELVNCWTWRLISGNGLSL